MKPEVEAEVRNPKVPMGEGRLIFVSGPYNGESQAKITENIWHACRVAVRLWELGWFCICPHMNMAHFEVYSSLPEKVYLKGDLKFLEKCDCVFMLKGYENSKGAKAELELAKKLGLAVYYEEEVTQ